MQDAWLPPPEPGTPVCGGFDGSSVDDCTVFKLETRDGRLFTPRYGPDRLPTIWQADQWGGQIPRLEVEAARQEIRDTYRVERMYCDPFLFQTEIENWAADMGEDVVVQWPTNRVKPMHAALSRFVTDLSTGVLTHDGCPITTLHVNNARKLARPSETYVLGKPSPHQKIDAGMASVLAHEAACDARADGWGDSRNSTFLILS